MSRYPLPHKNHEVVKDICELRKTINAIDADVVALETKTKQAQEEITKANATFVHTGVSLVNNVIQDIAPRRYLAVSKGGIRCVDSSDNVGGRSGQCSIKKSDANFDVAWGDIWETSKNGTTTLQNALEAGQNESHIFCDVPEIDNDEQLPRNNLVNTQIIGDHEIESNEGVVLIDSLERIMDTENVATRKNRGVVKIGPGVHVADGSISTNTAQNATKENFGIVKIGSGITIDDGVISVEEISQATEEKFGVVKLGHNLQVNENGAMEIREMPTTIYDLGKIKICNLGNINLEEAVARYRAFITEDLVIKINLGFIPSADFSFVLELVADGIHLISFEDSFDTKMKLFPVNRGTTRLHITKRLGIPYYNVVIDRANAPKPVNLVASREAICEDYIAWAPNGSNWSVLDILRDYYDGYSDTTELCFEFTKLVCVDFVKYWSRSEVPMGEFILKGSNDGRNWTTLLYRNEEIIYGEVKTDEKGCFRFYHLFIGYTSDDNKPGGVSLWGTEIEDNDLSELRILTPYMNANETAFAKLTASNIAGGSAGNLTDNDYGSYIEIKPSEGNTSRWAKYELTEPAAANMLEINMNTWSEQANWFKLEGSNDDENWNLLLERQYQGNEIYVQRKTLFYHLNNEMEYRYYRLTCIATNNSGNSWRLCGFKLYQYRYRESRSLFQSIMPIMSSTKQDGYEISASSEAGRNETVLQAFDGNSETQWATSGAVGSWVRVKLPTPTICRELLVTARNSQWYCQAPVDFEIQGSNDGENWMTLSHESELNWVQGEQKSFSFENESGYLYYRIYINAVQNGDYAAIAKLEFGNTILEYKRHLKKYDYLVPVMNAATASGEDGNYAAIANDCDSFGTVYNPYNRTNDNFLEVPGTTGWTQIELPTAKIANEFLIGARNGDYSGDTPRDYTLFGSNDNISWMPLFSISNSDRFNGSENRTHAFESAVPYKYYRLNFSNPADRDVVSIARFELMHKYIITD